MQLWRDLESVPAAPDGRVVSIGNFDGVHRGHQSVLAQTRALASDLGCAEVVVVTFDPHPMAVLRPDHAPPTLTTVEERATLLAAAGADGVIALPFNSAMASWSPEEFIDRVLVDGLGVRGVVVGANFRFGSRASGDVGLLAHVGQDRGFVVRAVTLEGGPMVWSSTYLRHCLAAGDVAGAAEALGRPVVVSGVVQRGDQRGRELGYPTANVAIGPASMTPGDGVYAGWVRWGNERLPAAISVGTNPTFAGQRERRVEAYVIDRTDLQLYGEHIEVEFAAKLRDMERFDSLEALLVAMAADVRLARTLTS